MRVWKSITFMLWFAIVAAILGVIFIILSFLTPNSSISLTEFKQNIEEEGYIFINENLNTGEGNIISYGKGVIEDNIGIEYFEFNSYTDGTKLREQYRDIIKEQIQGGKSFTLDVNKYYKYTKENEKEYAIIIQIDKTMIYAKVPINYKKNVVAFMKRIEYIKYI